MKGYDEIVAGDEPEPEARFSALALTAVAVVVALVLVGVGQQGDRHSYPVVTVTEMTATGLRQVPVLDRDGREAVEVDLGQLALLLGARHLAETQVVTFPPVVRGAEVIFHLTPPPALNELGEPVSAGFTAETAGESWHVEFWFMGQGAPSIDGYTLSRTSDPVELQIPVLTVAPGEQFSAKVETARTEQTELNIAVQRIGAPGDPSHQAGVLYGPRTEYRIPLVEEEGVSVNQ